jgi:hypothetical protein
MTSGHFFRPFVFFLSLVTSLALTVLPAHAAELTVSTPDLTAFIDSVKDGQGGVVRGVYVANLFALKVLQQPANDPAYVSPVQNVATEFRLAREAGTLGLLAHNFLAGANFAALQPGQEIQIVLGDGKVETFKVTRILRYQSLQPANPSSPMVSLETGEKLSSAQLFEKVYRGNGHLVLQTCLSQNGELSWGRMFILAEPVKN